MSGTSPPRFARLLASLGVGADDRALALADLAERFELIAADEGQGAARRWYWWQAVRGLWHRIRPDVELLRRRSWSGTWSDLRQSGRTLIRRPAYASGVVGTLTVGLGSAALVGTVAWNVWLAPMPFPDPDRVVRLFELRPPDAEAGADAEPTRYRISPPLLEDLRAHDWTTVSAVAGVARNDGEWRSEGEVTRLSALTISPELLEILDVRPLHGRLIGDDPDAREAVLTRELWTRSFGGDPSVVGGASMVLDGEPHRIVGVVELPSGYPEQADLVMPFRWGQEQLVPGMRGARYLDVIARVRTGFDVDDASAEMERLVAEAGRRHAMHEGWGGEAVVLGDELLRPYRPILAMLLAAATVFLLLAVVNVTGLVTARSVDARFDRGIRLALGASEGRLLRGSLVESGLMAGLAAVLAVALARWALPPIKGLIPEEVPRLDQVTVGPGWLAMVVGVSLAAGCVVAVVAHLVSRDATPGARKMVDSRARPMSRNVMVVSQVALTTVLLIGGAAILSTVLRMQRVDLGFDPSGVVSTRVMTGGDRYASEEARLSFWRRLLEEARGRGLDAALGTSPPMAGVNMRWGYLADPTADEAFAQYHIVSPGYFSVMGIEVLDGRPFTDEDHEAAAPVVVVNEALAEAAFADEPAVGRRIRLVGEEKTVVGVVEGTRHFGPAEPVPQEIYAPFAQDPWGHAQLLVRGSPAAVGGPVAEAAAAVDPNLGVAPVQPYQRFVREWYAGLRLQLLVVGVLATVGTVLATLGLYALMAYRVSSRRREIGVRLALGASKGSVFGAVVRQGLAVAVVGVAVGLALWYGASPLAARWLGELDPASASLALLVALLLTVTSAVAAGIPARRSVTVDPARTLREE